MKFTARSVLENGTPTRKVFCKKCKETGTEKIGCESCKQFFCYCCETWRPADYKLAGSPTIRINTTKLDLDGLVRYKEGELVKLAEYEGQVEDSYRWEDSPELTQTDVRAKLISAALERSDIGVSGKKIMQTTEKSRRACALRKGTEISSDSNDRSSYSCINCDTYYILLAHRTAAAVEMSTIVEAIKLDPKTYAEKFSGIEAVGISIVSYILLSNLDIESSVTLVLSFVPAVAIKCWGLSNYLKAKKNAAVRRQAVLANKKKDVHQIWSVRTRDTVRREALSREFNILGLGNLNDASIFTTLLPTPAVRSTLINDVEELIKAKEAEFDKSRI
jgi:hypothetical protein